MNRKQRRAQARGAAGAPAPLAEAVAAFQAGRIDDAARTIEAALRRAPADADLLNLAAAIADRQGRIQDSIALIRRAIAARPDAPEHHGNLGVFLRKAGRPEEAEAALRRALELRPGFPDACWNLANLMLDAGRTGEAEAAWKAGHAAAPSQTRFAVRLSGLYLQAGRRAEAEQVLSEAVQAWSQAHAADPRTARVTPQDVQALSRLGALVFHGGRRRAALPYLQLALELGAGPETQAMFGHCVGKIRFGAPQPRLKPLLARALEEVWIAPADLMRVSANLLLREPEFIEAERLAREAPQSLLASDAAGRAGADPLLLAVLRTTVVTSRELEALLTALRAALLLQREAQTPAPAGFEALTLALAHQGFANEYAFAETPEETAALDRLEARIGALFQSGGRPEAADLAILAAYRPLHQAPWAEAAAALDWPEDAALMIRRQILEPLEERALEPAIEELTPISDAISQAVRGQYEENPYPRWLAAPGRSEASTLTSWLASYFPRAPAPAAEPQPPLQVLIAGCGTGQQSVGSSLRFASAELLAVDLSRASLAYAIRKTRELGIANVAYAQADILGLGAIGRSFDVVESTGVLHHLADPLKGWRVLADLTRPGGYMLLALYSERARVDLEPVRAFAAEGGYGRSESELRRFRSDILALPPDHPAAGAAARRDFYSLSMLRDLVFHVKEHRFTPLGLKSAIEGLGLQFCGFSVEPEVQAGFAARFGQAADPLSLDQWDLYEAEQPQTFVGMYQFLVRRPEL